MSKSIVNELINTILTESANINIEETFLNFRLGDIDETLYENDEPIFKENVLDKFVEDIEAQFDDDDIESVEVSEETLEAISSLKNRALAILNSID